jgi:hypothetical protein
MRMNMMRNPPGTTISILVTPRRRARMATTWSTLRRKRILQLKTKHTRQVEMMT